MSGIQVIIKKNENIEKAIRRWKRKLENNNILLDIRNKRYFQKPSIIKREKKKRMNFQHMLKCRYQNE